MFTLRANQNARKRRGVSRTDMPAVRTDDSGEHEHGYRRRERGRKRKRSFPLFRARGRDLPPWVRLVTRRRLARTAEPWPTGAGRPCVIAGGQYPEKVSTPKRARRPRQCGMQPPGRLRSLGAIRARRFNSPGSSPRFSIPSGSRITSNWRIGPSLFKRP